MIREIGDRNSELWLLGDSNPKNWDTALSTPFDPRHPAIHSIWTPILNSVQDHVYRTNRLRIDTSDLYIRNAIENPDLKPKDRENEWSQAVEGEVQNLRNLLDEFGPKFIFSFGAFSFEFARRALHEEPKRPHSFWGAKNMGEEFRRRIQTFDLARVNIFPLLHVSIARRFLQSHNYYSAEVGGNYFDHVAGHLSHVLLMNSDELDIWIK
jgi:hypothetical protein